MERRGNRILATFRNIVTGTTTEREGDQIVVEHGTLPADALYRELRAHSANDGVTDIDALLAIKPQPRMLRPGAASSFTASATPWPVGTSTPRFSTPCVFASPRDAQ